MKKLRYLVVDTETATLPFVSSLGLSEKQRKVIACTKSLVYDIGWCIVDRKGNIEAKRQFLVTEIFSVPAVFNTAYYHEKRPLYLDMLRRGDTKLATWYEVMEQFVADCDNVDFIGAYNAAFDCRAINFTELYINKLYSPSYYDWEQYQRNSCLQTSKKSTTSNSRDTQHFIFRGKKYKVFDLWGMSCESLINTNKYKDMCLDREMVSPSGLYFKTSAETSFRYMTSKYDFMEAHTALDDAMIEAQLLVKILHRKAVTQGIATFPFRNLGTTCDYLTNSKKVDRKKVEYVIGVMEQKLENSSCNTSFYRQIENCIVQLRSLLE